MAILRRIAVALAIVSLCTDAKKHDKKHDVSFGQQSEPIPIQQGAPTYTCPEEYELINGNQCVKYQYAPKITSCKTGQFKGNQCLEYTDVIYKCPAGFTVLNDDKKNQGNSLAYNHGHNHDGKKKGNASCYKMDSAPAIHTCPAGTYQSEKNPNLCAADIKLPASAYCPISDKKSSKHGNDNKYGYRQFDCIDYQAVAPTPYCPNHLALQGGVCTGQESFQCAAEVLCVGHNCAGGKKGGHKFLRRLQEESNESDSIEILQERRLQLESSTSTEERKLSEESDDTESTPDDRRLGKKKHEMTVSIPSKKSECLRNITIEPEYSCPPGSLEGSSKKSGHGNGYSNNGLGPYGHGHESHGNKDKKHAITCYNAKQIPLRYECNDGFLDSNNECQKTILKKSDEQCPIGYNFCFNKKQGNGKGGITLPCCKSEFANPTPFCVQGYNLAGSFCARAGDAYTTCPEGFFDNGHNCQKEHIKKATQLYNITMCQGKGCESGLIH